MIKYLHIGILALASLLASCSSSPRPHDVVTIDALPAIWPDYVGVTIPASIAPLNFAMASDSAKCVDVTISANGKSLTANGSEANFDIDTWRALISSSPDSLSVVVCALFPDGWRQYRPFPIYVSADTLAAYGLTYRRIQPGYEVYSKMGIYQRDLTSFSEDPIFENTEVPNSCVNCHTARQSDPDDFLFHIRGDHGATLISHNDKVEVLNTKTDHTIGTFTYPAYHPDGRFIAFSVNTTRQSFHQVSTKRLEVFDVASDIVIYDTQNHSVITSPLVNQTNSCWETFPCFSSDGKSLYFCATRPQSVPMNVSRVQYALMKIPFDAATGQLGDKIDTVLNLASQGLSISLPRTSPDGRLLMFTTCDYGTFPIWHSEADLWVLNLATGNAHPASALNSDDAESFHNWSPDSRWVVFSSRRGDGLFTRLFIAHVDENGVASKPFLLPQENPKSFYRDLMFSYNVPDFTSHPVKLDAKSAARRLLSPSRTQVK